MGLLQEWDVCQYDAVDGFQCAHPDQALKYFNVTNFLDGNEVSIQTILGQYQQFKGIAAYLISLFASQIQLKSQFVQFAKAIKSTLDRNLS